MRPGTSLPWTRNPARHDPPCRLHLLEPDAAVPRCSCSPSIFPATSPPASRNSTLPVRLGGGARRRGPGQPRGTPQGLGRARRGSDRGEPWPPAEHACCSSTCVSTSPVCTGRSTPRISRGITDRHRVRRFPEANRPPRQRRKVLGGHGGDSGGESGRPAPTARVASPPRHPGRGRAVTVLTYQVAESHFHPRGTPSIVLACKGEPMAALGKVGLSDAIVLLGPAPNGYLRHDGGREGREPPRQAGLPSFAVGWIRR